MRKMILVIVAALSFIGGFVAYSGDKQHHYIFFIHGIGGTHGTFGKMDEALKKHLTTSTQSVSTHGFVYSTKDNTKSTLEFAREFTRYMKRTVENNKDKNYKISIVAHSQGGLITLIWYHFAVARNSVAFGADILTPHLANIVTIGTPFWGSKIASAAHHNPTLYGMARTAFPELTKFGEQQLLALAIGSDTIQDFHDSIMMESDSYTLPNPSIRILNVGGYLNKDEFMAEKRSQSMTTDVAISMAMGPAEIESDGIVTLTSSTINSLFCNALASNYSENTTTPSTCFKDIQIADRYIAKGVHSTAPITEHLPIANVPDECVTNEKCIHPTFGSILNYLQGKDIPEVSDLEHPEFTTFAIEFNISLPQELAHYRELVTVEFIQPSRWNILNPRRFSIDSKRELHSSITYLGGEKHSNEINRWYSGYFYEEMNDMSQLKKTGLTVRAVIKAPGFKTRQVDVKIKPLESSFVKINLEKN